MDCFRDAGLPDGTINFLTGSGGQIGDFLVDHPLVAGITFTGSFEVGRGIQWRFMRPDYPRPVILEMGGKNPTIVSARADLDMAALGVMRSAFGLQGQKCSACSRVYVQAPVFQAFADKLAALADKIVVGDPTRAEVYLGPVINRKAYEDYQAYSAELAQAGRLLTGGQALSQGDLAKGYFCAPHRGGGRAPGPPPVEARDVSAHRAAAPGRGPGPGHGPGQRQPIRAHRRVLRRAR